MNSSSKNSAKSVGNHRENMAPSRKYSTTAFVLIFAIIIAITVNISGLLASTLASQEQMYLIWPILTCIGIYTLLFFSLNRRIRGNILSEIGIIYLAFALVYTVLPALTFWSINFYLPSGLRGLSLSGLLPEPYELGLHFWRHALFIAGVSIGYYAIRGDTLRIVRSPATSFLNVRATVIALFAIMIGSIVCVAILSAPVTTYHENYTRYEHLSWFWLRFVYVCLILKGGSYFALMAILFTQYKEYRKYILVIVPALCIYEIYYSLGSRIEALTILLSFIGFYTLNVKRISIKRGILYLVLLGLLFSAVELARSAAMNEESVQSMVASEGIKSASEFNAVFNTGFHLYSERAQGTIPPHDWRMLFYEFYALIPFVDHTKYHPQYWYARNYFPDAAVPPQTVGVIANSAIWGGEFDLLIRSILNGVLFALLARWFQRRRDKWWASATYVYFYSTSILTIKYSVFYQFSIFTKNIVPMLLFAIILMAYRKGVLRLK